MKNAPALQRRQLLKRALSAVSATAAGLLASAPRAVQAQPRYVISAERLQQAVDQRFPLRTGVAGMLQLTVQPPLLRLLPDADRVGCEMVVLASGPVLEAPSSGEFDLDFALRYEPGDRSIRAHRLRVRSLRISGLDVPFAQLLDTLREPLAQRSFGELVLHRLSEQDLALALTMGFEPDTIGVTSQGLVIRFAPTQRR